MASNQQPDLNPTQAWQQGLSRDTSASFVYAVAKLCRYLAAHRDRTVTLADLAKVARSSPFTVQRKFTRVLGVSPRAYQAQLRSSDVRRSLAEPGSSVTEAIYQAG